MKDREVPSDGFKCDFLRLKAGKGERVQVVTHCRREKKNRVESERSHAPHGNVAFFPTVSLPSNACALPSLKQGTFSCLFEDQRNPPKERPVMNQQRE